MTSSEAASRQLWLTCFGDSPSYVDALYRALYRQEDALLAYAGEKAIAQILCPQTLLKLFPRGQALPAGYVMGVCTLPAYRGQGVMRRLLLETLRRERARGDVFSVLIPATPQLYTLYAETAGFFPAFGERFVTGGELAEGCGQGAPSPSATVMDLALAQEREEVHPQLLHSLPLMRAAVADYQQSEGYSLRLHHSPAGGCDGALFLQEQGEDKLLLRRSYGTKEALEVLLSELQRDDAHRTLVHYLPPVRETTYPFAGEVTRGKGMARLLNLPILLEHYARSFPERELSFAYRDALFPEEDGAYRLVGGRVLRHPLPSAYPELSPAELLRCLGSPPELWWMSLLGEGDL